MWKWDFRNSAAMPRRMAAASRGYAELPRGSVQSSGCSPGATLESQAPACQDALPEEIDALTRLVESSRQWGGILVVSGAGISTESGIAGEMPAHLRSSRVTLDAFMVVTGIIVGCIAAEKGTCQALAASLLQRGSVSLSLRSSLKPWRPDRRRLQVTGEAPLQADDPPDFCRGRRGAPEVLGPQHDWVWPPGRGTPKRSAQRAHSPRAAWLHQAHYHAER